MRQPDIYTPSTIKKWDVDGEFKKGVWIPARPIGHNTFSWKWRFKLAWDVFIGKHDVLNWKNEKQSADMHLEKKLAGNDIL